MDVFSVNGGKVDGLVGVRMITITEELQLAFTNEKMAPLWPVWPITVVDQNRWVDCWTSEGVIPRPRNRTIILKRYAVVAFASWAPEYNSLSV